MEGRALASRRAPVFLRSSNGGTPVKEKGRPREEPPLSCFLPDRPA
jgi:hypothetical protein